MDAVMNTNDALAQTEAAQSNIEWIVTDLVRALRENGQPLSATDHLIAGVANRGRGLLNAFATLVNQAQLLTAFPLARLQLDSLLRLYGILYLTSDPGAVAEHVIKGTSLRRLSDRSGIHLTDRHLVDSFASQFGSPELNEIYEDLSGFIHLSIMHVKASVVIDDATGQTGLVLNGTLGTVEDAEEKLVNNFCAITKTLQNLVKQYYEARTGLVA